MANENVPPVTPYTTPAGAHMRLTWTSSKSKTLELNVSSEWMTLRKFEKPAAEMFHTYYRPVDAGKTKRPVTFVFNGGPGAASAYLHIGALGPKRVKFNADGTTPPPPARLENNTESWIEFTDLVFIDPIGTGFSRVIPSEKSEKEKPDPKKSVDEKEYYAVKRDLESLGEFIERFLSKHKLWDAPVYLAGESYGGFRTAKLARTLQERHGVGLSGVIAISPALEFSLLSGGDYDVLRNMDTFCSMALAAAHFGRSRVFAKGESIETMRPAIERFATRELGLALTVGSGHEEQELTQIFSRAADFLGLSAADIRRAHGRVPFTRFARELLRDQQRVVGFYDATITAVDPFPDRDQSEGLDPTLVGIERVYASGINQLLRAEIGIESDRRYELLSYEVFENWSRDNGKHIDGPPVGATDDLRVAMSLNAHMKVRICHGVYDLVTPYFSSHRLVDQMRLLPEQRAKMDIRHFKGGHMFYCWDESRIAFRDWVREMFEG